MMAILAGLVSVPIARLKRTRELLNNKTLIQFEELDKIMESGRNFAAYREELKKLDPPCTPFLGESISIPWYWILLEMGSKLNVYQC